jgi:3-hydroxybutyryl-CoA dehydrogenase
VVTDHAALPETVEVERPLVGVVGSGDLAVGIIETCARAGAEVRFVAGDDTKVKAAWLALEDALEQSIAKGRIDELSKKAALERITGSPEIGRLADCDLIIEAVAEDVSVKRSLFATIDDVAKAGAILVTTASAVPVIELAMATDRPAAVVGLHLPELPGKLAEVATTVVTSPEVAARAVALIGRLGLEVVRCRDRAGFIVDALRFPYLNDAARMLEAGYADADSIDAAMRLGCGYPAGPIAELDRLGLDRAVRVLRALYSEARQAALTPAPLLEEYLIAGRTLRS